MKINHLRWKIVVCAAAALCLSLHCASDNTKAGPKVLIVIDMDGASGIAEFKNVYYIDGLLGLGGTEEDTKKERYRMYKARDVYSISKSTKLTGEISPSISTESIVSNLAVATESIC